MKNHKHLGLTLDTKLSFVHHINEKTAIAKKGIGVIKYLSKFVSVKTLDQIYKAFVRPHLDYCDVVYHIPPNINLFDSTISLTCSMEKVERVQYQAALAVTGCWQGTNRNKLYEELGWESLSDRRWVRRMILFYKMLRYNYPVYLYEHIPRQRVPIYGCRSPHVFHEIKCRTSKYMNSFFPHCVKSWNTIDDRIRNSDTLNIFKHRLYSLVCPIKKATYSIHNPVTNTCICRG